MERKKEDVLRQENLMIGQKEACHCRKEGKSAEKEERREGMTKEENAEKKKEHAVKAQNVGM